MIQTQQARSQKTLENILNATEGLLITAEHNDLTVQQIARAARVTTGAVYARFENKLAIMEELLNRYVEQSRQTLEAFLKDAEIVDAELVGGVLVDAMVNLFSKHKGVVRMALAIAPYQAENTVMQEVNNLYEQARLRLAQVAKELGNDSPNKASAFVLTLLIAACRETIAVNEKARFIDMDLQVFSQELAYAIRCYLKG